jgi:hypothetical protein
MKIQKMITIAILALGSMGALLPSSNPASAAGGTGEYHTDGPATCNCLQKGEDPKSTELHTVCASKTIKVSVGSSVLSVETGLTESTCAAKDIKPGKCLYYVYNFVCEYGGWWDGWECEFLSASAKTRNTTDEDCKD